MVFTPYPCTITPYTIKNCMETQTYKKFDIFEDLRTIVQETRPDLLFLSKSSKVSSVQQYERSTSRRGTHCC